MYILMSASDVVTILELIFSTSDPNITKSKMPHKILHSSIFLQL